MSDSTSTLTGAGYQPDGSGAQQDNNLPKGGQGEDGQKPAAPENQEQAGKDGAKEKGGDQTGNPLTALVQSRQQTRDASSQYEAQIAVMQQEIANLKAQGAKPETPQAWKNPYNETEEPVDHLRAELEHTRAEMQQLRQEGTQELQDSRSARALTDFEQNVAQEISMAAQATPEILQAYGYVNQQVTKMHEGQGLSGTRLANAVRNSILQAFVNGQTNGLTHTQTTAQMALNMGFSTGNGASKPDPVKRGQKAADQSVGHATGAGGDTTPPSAQKLAKMSKSELKADGGAGLNRIKAMLRGDIPVE